MTLLDMESNLSVSARECASALMDVVPLVMRTVRCEIRNHRPADLSVPQFRTLAYVSRREHASVSDVAEHLGLTLPSTSKTIDGLVKRGLLQRTADPEDRRRSILQLSGDGSSTLESAQQAALDHMAQMLGEVSEADIKRVFQAMQLLRPVFVRCPEAVKTGTGALK